MDNGQLVPKEQHPLSLPSSSVRGFPVEDEGKVPAIGSTGVTTQMFCPLIKAACLKHMCMFWVELFSDKTRVAHCAYYWNAVQLTDIKTQLLVLNKQLSEKLTHAEHAQT